MSDEDDSDAKSVKSFNSSISSQNSNSKDSEIPDVTNWDKFRICRYLSKRGLPDFVTDKIIDCVRHYDLIMLTCCLNTSAICKINYSIMFRI